MCRGGVQLTRESNRFMLSDSGVDLGLMYTHALLLVPVRFEHLCPLLQAFEKKLKQCIKKMQIVIGEFWFYGERWRL